MSVCVGVRLRVYECVRARAYVSVGVHVSARACVRAYDRRVI